jgi:hypothetical protein
MLGTVLLQPFVAQFAIVKAVLDEVKDVLDPAADVRLDRNRSNPTVLPGPS